MKQHDYQFIGAGGKGGGGGPTSKEDPDTLQASSSVKFVHLICEGEIEGLVDGFKSIYINETPLFSGRVNSSTPYKALCVWDTSGSATFVDSPYVIRLWSGTLAQLQNIKAGMEVVGTGIPEQTFVKGVRVSEMTYTSGYNKYGANTKTKKSYEILLSQQPLAEKSGNPAALSLEPTELSFYEIGSGALDGANFRNFALSYRLGTAAQEPFENIDSIETQLTGISSQNPIEPENPVFVSVPSDAYNSVKLSIYTPALLQQVISEKGVHTKGSFVSFSIDIKDDVSDWQTVVTDSFNGKSSSLYSRDYRVPLADPAKPYTIRIRRTSALPTDSNVQNKIFLQYASGVRDLRLTYTNSVVFSGMIEAKQFSSIPRVTYHLKLLKVKVPKNYNPTTRTYSTSGEGTTGGVWNGEFKIAWTDNPAWCFYDLATNERYGLGAYVTEDDIDKWTLYTIAQYCDELVPDGAGGTEPRFRCNLFLQEREEAIRVLANFASLFRGIAFWANGKLSCMQDSPSDPVLTFNNANVLGGVFSYTGTPVRNRHTVALVSWNDPTDFSKQKIEYVEDSAALAKYGLKEIELTAFGCTSRAQAHRYGKWMLFSSQNETELVAFEVGLDGAKVAPGEVIYIADKYRAGKRTGGRCKSATTTGLEMDAEFQFESGKSYSVILTAPDLAPVAVEVTNPGTTLTNRLTFASPIDADKVPATGSIFALSIEGELVPQTFRVIGVKESGPGRFILNAMAHNPSKYAAVENDLALEDYPVSSLPSRGYAEPPTNVVVVEENIVVQEGIRRELFVSWTAPTGALTKEFVVEYQSQDSSWLVAGSTSGTSMAIPVAVPQSYFVRVKSVNLYGVSSTYATAAVELKEDYLPVASITGLELRYQGGDTVFEGQDVELEWRITSPATSDSNATFNAIPAPAIDYFLIEVYDLTQPLAGGGFKLLREDRSAIPAYYYSYDMNNKDTEGEPSRYLRFDVYGKDLQGRYTAIKSLTVSNPAPLLGASAPTPDTALFRTTARNGLKFFEFSPPTDNDFSEFAVFISTSPSFNVASVVDENGDVRESALVRYDAVANTGMLLYKGSSASFSANLTPGTVYRVVYCALDLFGFEGAVYYGPAVVPVGTPEVDNVPPEKPSNPTLTTASELASADGSVVSRIFVSFARNTEADLSLYGYGYRKITGAPIITGGVVTGYTQTQTQAYVYETLPARTNGDGYVGDPSGTVTFPIIVDASSWYEVVIWAIDQSGNRSAQTSLVSSAVIQAAGDTFSPNTPTGLVATSDRNSVRVSWQRSGEKDLAFFDVFRASSATPAPTSSSTPTVTGDFTTWVSTGGTIGVAEFFWVRSGDRSGNRSSWAGPVSAAPVALTDADLSAIGAAKVAGNLVNATLPPANLSSTLTTANFATTLRPPEVVAALPSTGNYQGRLVLLTVDNKLYRWTSTATTGTSFWTAAVASTDITGTISDAQIAALDAAKITGQLTNAQIADLAAAKLTGQITSTQITDNSITTAKIAAGAITAGKIAADSITANEIAANAITASELAAGSVTTAKLVAGAVTANEIAAGAVTTAKLVAGAVTANELAANSVTANKILAGSVTAAAIAAKTITSEKMILADTSNRAENPNFGEGNVAWVSSGGAALPTGGVSIVTGDTANAYIGNSYLQIAAPAGIGLAVRNTNIFPVTPGDRYYLRAAARAVSSPTGGLSARIRFLQADKSTLVSAQGPTFDAATDTAWTVRDLSFAVPASAVFAWIDFTVNTSAMSGSGVWRVGEIFCHRQNAAELIVDGSISSDKIAANAVTAGKISTNAVTAGTIAAGAVTAGTIAAGAVVAGTLAADAVVANNIASNAITSAKIASGAITADKIGAGEITAAKIAAGAITADRVAANALLINNFKGACLVFNPRARLTDDTEITTNATWECGFFSAPTYSLSNVIRITYYWPADVINWFSQSSVMGARYGHYLKNLRANDGIIFYAASFCSENAARVVRNESTAAYNAGGSPSPFNPGFWGAYYTGYLFISRPLTGTIPAATNTVRTNGQFYAAYSMSNSRNINTAFYSQGKDALLINFDTALTGTPYDAQILGAYSSYGATTYKSPTLATENILTAKGDLFNTFSSTELAYNGANALFALDTVNPVYGMVSVTNLLGS